MIEMSNCRKWKLTQRLRARIGGESGIRKGKLTHDVWLWCFFEVYKKVNERKDRYGRKKRAERGLKKRPLELVRDDNFLVGEDAVISRWIDPHFLS